jgi:hypothetical protein
MEQTAKMVVDEDEDDDGVTMDVKLAGVQEAE